MNMAFAYSETVTQAAFDFKLLFRKATLKSTVSPSLYQHLWSHLSHLLFVIQN